MLVDLREIPAANSSAGEQDHFELFAREYLSALGYEILEQPDRGADGGKDMLVQETLRGINKTISLKWLVSAKHFAHSGESVTPSDEVNILERVEKFRADGFLGFYSTLPSAGLNANLNGITSKIRVDHFDSASIERHLTTDRRLSTVFRRFLPASYQEFHRGGGYVDADLNFPVIDFKLFADLSTGKSEFVTPLVTIHGRHVLKNVHYSIEESKFTHTAYNPVFCKSSTEVTLYIDTETALQRFPITPQLGNEVHLHCLVASDRGTFSQYTTAEISPYPPKFDVLHTTVMRGKQLIFSRRKIHSKTGPTYVDEIHA